MSFSEKWVAHFRLNQLQHADVLTLPGETIPRAEKERIAFSIAEFQRGESSQARNFLRKARVFSAKTEDPEFLIATQLFVK